MFGRNSDKKKDKKKWQISSIRSPTPIQTRHRVLTNHDINDGDSADIDINHTNTDSENND